MRSPPVRACGCPSRLDARACRADVKRPKAYGMPSGPGAMSFELTSMDESIRNSGGTTGKGGRDA